MNNKEKQISICEYWNLHPSNTELEGQFNNGVYFRK